MQKKIRKTPGRKYQEMEGRWTRKGCRHDTFSYFVRANLKWSVKNREILVKYQLLSRLQQIRANIYFIITKYKNNKVEMQKLSLDPVAILQFLYFNFALITVNKKYIL